MKKKAAAIAKILDEYFPNPNIPLTHRDPYTLLIAVLLSAQCTDARVNQITPKLFSLANTPYKMVQLSIEEIKKIILPCGLSTKKATAIWNLSNDLIQKYHGKVPRTFEELEELPGVGHKTASVVISHAFHLPAFPVDTHIHRCAKRWGLSKGKNRLETEKDLKKQFPQSLWNKIHLQIIYFARTYCRARGHKPEVCPICKQLPKTRQT